MDIMRLFEGYKTLMAGIGLLALGVYQITQGEMDQGMRSIAEGLAVIGLGAKLERAAKASEVDAGLLSKAAAKQH